MPCPQVRICSICSTAMRIPSFAAWSPPCGDAFADLFRNIDPRDLVVQEIGVPGTVQRQHTHQNRELRRGRYSSVYRCEELLGFLRLVHRLGEEEVGAIVDLAAQHFHLAFRVLGGQVEGAADEEVGRLADLGAGVVQTAVEPLFDQFDQTRGGQVVIVHRFGVVPDLGWVPITTKILRTPMAWAASRSPCRRSRLRPAGGEVQGGLDPDIVLKQVADRPGAHPHAGHWAVGDIDHISADFVQQAGPGEELVGGEAARRVHLHTDGKVPGGKLLGQVRLFLFLRGRRWRRSLLRKLAG